MSIQYTNAVDNSVSLGYLTQLILYLPVVKLSWLLETKFDKCIGGTVILQASSEQGSFLFIMKNLTECFHD